MEILKEFEGLGGGRQPAGDLEEKARRRSGIGEEEVIELGRVPFMVRDLEELQDLLYV